eukprot:jgi/Psemu1/26850/gm1.26850_g
MTVTTTTIMILVTDRPNREIKQILSRSEKDSDDPEEDVPITGRGRLFSYKDHKLVVDYAQNQNRPTGKKNIRKVQSLEVEEEQVLYTYNIFVNACNDMEMPVNVWHTQWGQCLPHSPRKIWNEIMQGRAVNHSREGFKTVVQAFVGTITPDPHPQFKAVFNGKISLLKLKPNSKPIHTTKEEE